jgi:hypothetical protein
MKDVRLVDFVLIRRLFKSPSVRQRIAANYLGITLTLFRGLEGMARHKFLRTNTSMPKVGTTTAQADFGFRPRFSAVVELAVPV